MAEEDALSLDNIECGVCAEYTDAVVYGRLNSGSNKEAFEMGERRLHLSWTHSERYVRFGIIIYRDAPN